MLLHQGKIDSEYFFQLFHDVSRFLSFSDNTLSILLHETEAETARDHATLNFKAQDVSSLKIVVQKLLLD